MNKKWKICLILLSTSAWRHILSIMNFHTKKSMSYMFMNVRVLKSIYILVAKYVCILNVFHYLILLIPVSCRTDNQMHFFASQPPRSPETHILHSRPEQVCQLWVAGHWASYWDDHVYHCWVLGLLPVRLPEKGRIPLGELRSEWWCIYLSVWTRRSA